MAMKTYAIHDHLRGMVKIGRSIDPTSRLRTLQTSCGTALRLLGVIEGDREAELHERLAAARALGEWFILTEYVAKQIAATFGVAVAASTHSLLPVAPTWKAEMLAAVILKIGGDLREPELDLLEDALFEPLMDFSLRAIDPGEGVPDEERLTEDERAEYFEEANADCFHVQELVVAAARAFRSFWVGFRICEEDEDGYFNIHLVFQRPKTPEAVAALLNALRDATIATEDDWTELIRVWPLFVSEAHGLEDMLGEVY